MCKNAGFQHEPSFYDERMAQQLLLDILPPPAPTFDNLVTGENGAAIAAVRQLASGEALYVWGPGSSGRSHLLKAAATEHPSGRYIAAEGAATVLAKLADGEVQTLGLVAVDDVHRLDEAGLAGLFSLYNRWREQTIGQGGFAILVSGDTAPLQMPIREDLRSRLGWGAVYRLWPLSDLQKFDALMGFAASRGAPLAPEVVRWLLTHGSRDMGSLFAWVDALERFALAQHRPITLPLLRSMLAQPNSVTHETHPSRAV